MKRLALAGVALLVACLATGSTAVASGGTKVCVPTEQGKPLVTPKKGVCKSHYTLTEFAAAGKEGSEGESALSAEERALLKDVLPHIKYLGSGVGGMPTIQFSGVNVQIVNGEGKTASANGEGNLVIGYDEAAEAEQTGSHDLILGEQQTYTSYGGILAGSGNAITDPFASVSGGRGNIAEGEYASVSGGFGNTASGREASVSGGGRNTASDTEASVSGGFNNLANSIGASVSGGSGNTASAAAASVSGGSRNNASGEAASVSGGENNTASGEAASIFGGTGLEASAPFDAKP